MKSFIYFVNWAVYGRKHFVPDLPAEYLTHILYAFANIRPETGEVYLSDTWSDTDQHFQGDSWNDTGKNLYGNFKQLYILKRKYTWLKVLLSIGGWTYSPNFAPVASDPARRTRFVSSAVELLKNLGLDGLDIDWEYPKGQEASDYVSLLCELRQALDEYALRVPTRPRFLLTVATSCAPENIHAMRVAEMDRYLDFWNLMAYDFAGPTWSKTAGHQANVYGYQYSIDKAIEMYRQAGVHPSKMIMGMPLYGRAFGNTDGPAHGFQGDGGTGTWENGVFDYKVLPRPGAREYFDRQAIASYSYDSGKRIMITYDTPECSKIKARYIRDNSLGGVMWWESSGDAPISSDRSIVRAVVDDFGGQNGLDKSDKNCLHYSESVYDNIRSS
ncbi:glycoside hydrolase superfamily [Lipomyces tetrasporus]|uniref:chitinase n=1 Tax=Lipomyces tetrasporus TaxID=54092 RepID=A0AAD7VQ52_9ASCO|nr:glycoside hydrolase superfamily [Lipomyces tetrasporus]KAJ8096775.1 glycoside hydrolase superfamily [Lipomyces tetrasporus]